MHRILVMLKLDQPSLRNCRLVQRSWMAICNEFFLLHVCIKDTTSPSRLLEIARNEVVAEHVKSITYTSVRFGATTQYSDTAPSDLKNTRFRFKRLMKITVSDGPRFPTIDWTSNVNTAATVASSCTRQLDNLHAIIADTGVNLAEVWAEWLNTSFFFSKGTTIGSIWKSLTVLRLGIVHSQDSDGCRDLKVVLRGLTNIRKLHLACREDFMAELDFLIDKEEVPWNQLSDLTLRGFAATECALQSLLELPTVRRISLGFIILINEGCWFRDLEDIAQAEIGESMFIRLVGKQYRGSQLRLG